uniref:Uncharacterized protein n=1 Tax=Romanomermis culicivorax TaxID=13658 RepID=A0A915J2V2_ROMCU
MFKYLPVVLLILAWTYDEDVVDGLHWTTENKHWFDVDESTDYPVDMELWRHEFPFGMTPAEKFLEMTTTIGQHPMETCFYSPLIKKCARKIAKHMKLRCFTHGQCPTYEMTNKQMVRKMLCNGEIPTTFCATMSSHGMNFPWYKKHEFEYIY